MATAIVAERDKAKTAEKGSVKQVSPKNTEQPDASAEVEVLVAKAQDALRAFENYNQEQVDAIVKAMTLAGVAKRLVLARMAVDETGMGVFEDKVTKNLFSTEYIYNNIKNKKTVGVIDEDFQGVRTIADPVGIVAAITPVTNPTSTVMFKSLIAIKTRNPIIFAFHPKAQNCCIAAAKTMLHAAVKAGAPEDCIQWIEHPSIEMTNALMKNDGIATILATGGSGMVKAAYSSGHPALGVGPGNVPAYIEKTANVNKAVNDIVMSKTFDNGTICASEQSVIVDKEIADQVLARFAAVGAYILSADEAKKVEALAIDPKRCAMSPAVVGQSAAKIAKLAGVNVPSDAKVLIARLTGVGPETPLSREKLSPILGFYVAESREEAIELADKLLHFGGLGHTACIHSQDKDAILEFGKRMKASRVIENAPTSLGAIGDLYNRIVPSLTLGCGAAGGNSTSDNVTVDNLRLRSSSRKARWSISDRSKGLAPSSSPTRLW